jgi:hypothetical protein
LAIRIKAEVKKSSFANQLAVRSLIPQEFLGFSGRETSEKEERSADGTYFIARNNGSELSYTNETGNQAAWVPR